MAFFLDPEVLIGNKFLELVYILIGLTTVYAGITNLFDKNNPAPLGTAIFWCSFGFVCIFGRFLPPTMAGAFVIIMILPAVFKQVAKGTVNTPAKEYTVQQFKKIGMKIFLPALCIGFFALLFALCTNISSLVGVSVGVLVAILLLMVYSKNNTPKVFVTDSERFLSTMGPLCMLPQFLACLGSIFTEAGVGSVIAKTLEAVIPPGNTNVGIVFFALGMVLFTILMGSAYAAITVMTVGIGAPFILQHGANPALIGMIGLTCGFCGTLCTPMAANFNIVPVAILDMKNKFGVIKNQLVVAGIMLIIQICYMLAFH